MTTMLPFKFAPMREYGELLIHAEDQILPVPKPDMVIGEPEIIAPTAWQYDRYGQFRKGDGILAFGRFAVMLHDVIVHRHGMVKDRWHIQLDAEHVALESYRHGEWFAANMGDGFYENGEWMTAIPFDDVTPIPKMGKSTMMRSMWDDNYAHFIHETCPRLDYVNRFPRTGLTGENWSRGGNTRWHFDELLFPSFWPHVSLSPDPIHWLRDRFGQKKHGDMVLWLSRSDATKRRILNEAEVLRAISDWGFPVTTMIPGNYTEEDQVKACANASIIIGPHGAGFINTIFAHQAAVIELIPKAYQHPMYQWMNKWAGNWYARIICDADHNMDMTIDLDQLKQVLAEARGTK